MSIENEITKAIEVCLKLNYQVEIDKVEFQSTNKDFKGDITIVVFSLVKYIRDNPVKLGNIIGEYLKNHIEHVIGFNVVKGFLNIVISDKYYIDKFKSINQTKDYGLIEPHIKEKAVMVEYSSPNTNKPLHLGHIRNSILGFSLAQIIKACGSKVYKTQIINDRGIHICKSMIAWQKFGKGETPESTGLKGDKLVGKYYIAFEKAYKKEVESLVNKGMSKETAQKKAPILIEAKSMLGKWEAKDPKTLSLWRKMNLWAYSGFKVTYNDLGVNFDKNYYESNTYLLGKNEVLKGLEKGVFYKKKDGSVWIDLTDQGLDQKLVLRADGTSVYMTQDIGTVIERFKDFDINSLIYTVGNEQDYHFKVLFIILKKLGYKWADKLYHLSYGMVDLPCGKMKSREGTVVDADDLIKQMKTTAKQISQELGKLEGYCDREKEELYSIIGMGALKYYILKVDPKKRILFDPKESIDFQGNTGPFIQYTYARIESLLRRANDELKDSLCLDVDVLSEKERSIIQMLLQFPKAIQHAAQQYNPALVANYTYSLVKVYNSFYQSTPIFTCSDLKLKNFRVNLSSKVGSVIKLSFSLLGIKVPERM